MCYIFYITYFIISNNKISKFDSTSEDGYLNTNFNYTYKLNKIDKIIYNLDQYSNGYNFGHYYENEENNKIIGGDG